MQTLDALERARQRHPDSFEPGSSAEAAALQRFASFFSTFSGDRIERLLPATYAADVWFNDTLKTLQGRDALAHYLAESAAAVEQCTVSIEEQTRTEHGEYLLRWKMCIRFKRFRRGIDTWTVGMSHLRFDRAGQVVYHQDYWNAAEGLYQHVPVLGWMIRAIQRRL